MAIAPPPSGLTATAVSDSQINLTWTNNDDYDIIYILRSENGTAYDEITGGINGSTTSYSDTGLEDNKHYWYRICGLTDPPPCTGDNLSDPDDDWTLPTANL